MRCAWLLMLAQSPRDRSVAADVLEAKGPLHWYRGNIHTHSLWSDGDDYLEMIATLVRDHGYDFLCFTDHNVLSNTRALVRRDEERRARKSPTTSSRPASPIGSTSARTDGRLEVRLRRFDEVATRSASPASFC